MHSSCPLYTGNVLARSSFETHLVSFGKRASVLHYGFACDVGGVADLRILQQDCRAQERDRSERAQHPQISLNPTLDFLNPAARPKPKPISSNLSTQTEPQTRSDYTLEARTPPEVAW